jgi:hypothetical protein
MERPYEFYGWRGYTMKTYSFNFVQPKRFKNRFIKVEANNPIEAKKLILEDLAKINERFTQVYEVKPGELKND